MLNSLVRRSLLRKVPVQPIILPVAHLSLETQPLERLQSFRTSENNPLNHSDDHIGQFYTIPSEHKKKLFLYGGLPRSYDTQTKTFNESCLMIRKPSVDVINCLRHVDYSKPAVRFILYGKKGQGKSLSLAHIIHYGYSAGFLIVHVPWVGGWLRRCQESSISEFKPGCIDTNLDAAAWLVHFKHQNSHLLDNPDLRTTQDHVWSKRESTPKDVPLGELVDHGINRIKFASQCIVVLAEEIKQLSREGKCKTLVVVDGFNGFFYPNTRILTEKKEVVHPKNVTVTEAFLNLSRFDWKNGAAVVTVDELAIAEKDHISHFPRYLLGRDGFEHMDPFVPVAVPTYTKLEFTSCMDYYRERRWVLPLDGQDEELQFLSAMNPYRLMLLCNSV
ncbi:hypothetical protein PPYR_14291 [Photinus pyralis]|uniref:Small ribosomal subunit protein mS29 n=1 Tax=Photinus pyralis TaxID=7054 RepID=A0A5N4A4V0_PHOPY|nr:28S ribosomal protein S29, mitochondrial [Photinus pyralis]KAB0792332.1 hypothetical protein PPYR_14291 [Photinus pyralis]